MKILTSKPVKFIYAILFAIFGISQIINTATSNHYLPSFLPFGNFWIYLIGAIMVAASVSIIFKKYTKTACLILSVVLLLAVFIVHIPGLFNPDFMQISMVNVLKDSGLAGGGLAIAGILGFSEAE